MKLKRFTTEYEIVDANDESELVAKITRFEDSWELEIKHGLYCSDDLYELANMLKQIEEETADEIESEREQRSYRCGMSIQERQAEKDSLKKG